MKTIIFIKTLLLAFTMVSNSYAEEVYYLFVQQDAKQLEETETKRQASEGKDKEVINLGRYNKDLRAVSRGSRLVFKIKNKEIIFRVDNTRRKNETRFSFSASSDNNDTLYIAENDGRVVGSLHHSGKLFKLRPNGKGETLLIEVPKEVLIDHDESYYEDSSNTLLKQPSPVSVFSAGSAFADSGAEFTVIVAYTTQFATAAGDVDAYMDLLELETNTAYTNSEVQTSVNIIHAYQTSYSDSGSFYTDRSYFSNAGNPETQELYDLRDLYQADIMMVLTGNGYSFCGIARTIGATESEALALGSETCSTGYYTFGHEIGHLFGARHIIANDSSTTPFPYGHGYCNVTPNTWRTVMAYGCPSGTGGPRIQQWSNPNVFINNEPTGTIDLEFNAMVMNVRADEVANFRSSTDRFDINGDGCIDQGDLIEMLPYLDTSVPPAPVSMDVNYDSMVDIDDYNLVIASSGLGCQ
ncbi:M12 family metallo-peptidase [Microbulbifer sp. 2201CG32-9]|uniref:M12 family metallo-peptidase n=1 Tax=Microbulbifer sp. 2201CG32-9 TaxID=3232309 RepID=UPI00345C4417